MLEVITENINVWFSAQAPKKSGGRGRSKNGAQNAHGIKKLRELIFELAVRGKLVPQDANDEPAAELIKKIDKEKTRLTKEEKIKKQKTLEDVSDKEKPYIIPNGWIWTRLGTISQINPRNEADDNSLVSFIPMPLISTSHKGEHDQEVRKWGSIKKGYTHFSDGDIGLAKITPCFENGKAVIFSKLKNGIGAGTTELHISRPYIGTVSARYLLLYLKSPELLLLGETKMTGTAGQKRVPKEFFSENPLPLPPLAEQHRIAAKVDELMALCDKLEQQQTDSAVAHQTLVETLLGTLTASASNKELQENWSRIENHFDTLFTTENSTEQLKQAILQLAVMGKLVPQDPNDKPASVMLEKIAKEKARLIKEGKIKKQKAPTEINDNEIPFELPLGWEWVRPDSFSKKITDGEHFRPPTQDEGVYFLSAKDIRSYGVSLDDPLYISKETAAKALERCDPEKGDILIVSRGATVGRMCTVDIDELFCLLGSVILIKPVHPILSEFLKIIMKSPHAFEQLVSASGSTAQQAIYLRDLKKILFPIAPLAEQKRIVTKVDELMAICDELKAKIKDVQTTQIQLANAIVERAVA